MSAPENIDDLFKDLLHQYGELQRDPEKLNHIKGLVAVAQAATKIAAIKLSASIARGQIPDAPILGDFSNLSKKATLKELSWRSFRAQIAGPLPEEEPPMDEPDDSDAQCPKPQ